MTVAQQQRNKAPSEVAQRYARAFYEIIAGKADSSAILERLGRFLEAIEDNVELQAFLSDTRFDPRNAAQFASALAQTLALGDDLRRLIGTVARNGRLPELGGILDAVQRLEAKAHQIVEVEVNTAQPLSDEQRGRLVASLEEAGYAHTSITEHLDPSLLGGSVIRVGSVLFDTSIAGRLARLQHAMKGAA